MENDQLTNQIISKRPRWKKLINFIYLGLCGFGFISRQIIILCIVAIAYNLAPDILNVPFSNLTLAIIFGNLLAAAVIIICIIAFFDIPPFDKANVFDIDNNYIEWLKAGLFFLLIFGLALPHYMS